MGEAAHAVFEVEAGGTEGGEVGRGLSASAPRTPGGSPKPCASTTSPQPRRLPAAKAASPAHPPRREPPPNCCWRRWAGEPFSYAGSMGEIRVGTAGWTDRSLIASGWYPPDANNPEKRLRYYARQFPLVEVDATYYALPAEQTARAWAERTPDGFTFNIKAFSLFTQHPTPVRALPADLREAAGQAGKERVYLKDVDPALTEQAWDRFLAALEPLRAAGQPGAGKLGAILRRRSPWFPISRANKDYILACAQRAAPRRVCVEFRNYTWMTDENREETLRFLADHQLPYVCVDMPQGYPSSIPPVLAATSDLAVVRMHGHSDKWTSKEIAERFGYRYSEDELAEWAPKIRGLAAEADTTHVVFNNCYSDYAHVNARQLADRLGT